MTDGDAVLVHAACSRIGRVLGGPDAVIAALRGAVGTAGTLMVVLDWDTPWEVLRDAAGRLPIDRRIDVPPFSAETTRGARKNGVLPEFLRTTPGARRSGNPGASVVALGARAADLTRDHALDYGYGPGSPFDRLTALGGKVLLLGAPTGSMTLLHHAEHLARLPDKHIDRKELPLPVSGGVAWRMVEEFETGEPVAPCLPQDHFPADHARVPGRRARAERARGRGGLALGRRARAGSVRGPLDGGSGNPFRCHDFTRPYREDRDSASAAPLSSSQRTAKAHTARASTSSEGARPMRPCRPSPVATYARTMRSM